MVSAVGGLPRHPPRMPVRAKTWPLSPSHMLLCMRLRKRLIPPQRHAPLQSPWVGTSTGPRDPTDQQRSCQWHGNIEDTNGHSHEGDQAQRPSRAIISASDQEPPEHAREVPPAHGSAKEDGAGAASGLGPASKARDHTRADATTAWWGGGCSLVESRDGQS
jgi:hypothetical protein